MKKNYGGGGHEGAAGAQISETQFIKILKTKTLWEIVRKIIKSIKIN